MLCRMNRGGIRTHWTPIKLQDVFEAVDPELAEPLCQLASGDVFGRRSSLAHENVDNDEGASARRALQHYLTSLMNDYGIVLHTNDLMAVEDIFEQYEDRFDRATSRNEAFNLLAERIKGKVDKNLDLVAEAIRRQDALESVGLSPLATLDETPSVQVNSNTEGYAEKEYLLDTEFIAIYW